MPHSGLTKTGTLRYCYFFHKTAVGHAAAAEVVTDITWHGDRAAHFVEQHDEPGRGAGRRRPASCGCARRNSLRMRAKE